MPPPGDRSGGGWDEGGEGRGGEEEWRDENKLKIPPSGVPPVGNNYPRVVGAQRRRVPGRVLFNFRAEASNGRVQRRFRRWGLVGNVPLGEIYKMSYAT